MSGYKFIVHVEVGIPGHAWVTISGPKLPRPVTVGFYPATPWVSTAGTLRNDALSQRIPDPVSGQVGAPHIETQRYEFNISEGQAMNGLIFAARIANNPPTYQLLGAATQSNWIMADGYQCTGFARDVGAAVGIPGVRFGNLPSSTSDAVPGILGGEFGFLDPTQVQPFRSSYSEAEFGQVTKSVYGGIARFDPLDAVNPVFTLPGQPAAPRAGTIDDQAAAVTPPPGLDTPARNSANFATAISGQPYQFTIQPGGTASDLWLGQRQAGNDFGSPEAFYKALMVNNPEITDINRIPAGAVLNVPVKFADATITYNYAGGTSINTNASGSQYTMVVRDPADPNPQNYTVYKRTLVDNEYETVTRKVVNGQLVQEDRSFSQYADSAITRWSSTQVDPVTGDQLQTDSQYDLNGRLQSTTVNKSQPNTPFARKEEVSTDDDGNTTTVTKFADGAESIEVKAADGTLISRIVDTTFFFGDTRTIRRTYETTISGEVVVIELFGSDAEVRANLKDPSDRIVYAVTGVRVGSETYEQGSVIADYWEGILSQSARPYTNGLAGELNAAGIVVYPGLESSPIAKHAVSLSDPNTATGAIPSFLDLLLDPNSQAAQSATYGIHAGLGFMRAMRVQCAGLTVAWLVTVRGLEPDKTIATKSMNPVTTCRIGIKNHAERLKPAFARRLRARNASRKSALDRPKHPNKGILVANQVLVTEFIRFDAIDKIAIEARSRRI